MNGLFCNKVHWNIVEINNCYIVSPSVILELVILNLFRE